MYLFAQGGLFACLATQLPLKGLQETLRPCRKGRNAKLRLHGRHKIFHSRVLYRFLTPALQPKYVIKLHFKSCNQNFTWFFTLKTAFLSRFQCLSCCDEYSSIHICIWWSYRTPRYFTTLLQYYSYNACKVFKFGLHYVLQEAEVI